MRNILKTGIFLTLKSVFRGNLRISLMTILMMSLVFINLLFAPALLNGLIDTINGKLRESITSDIILDSTSEDGYIQDADKFIGEISEIDGVDSATSRTNIGAEILYQKSKSSYGITVVSPESEKRVFDIENYLVEGEFLEEDDEGQIVLGVQIAGRGDKSLELYSSSLKDVHVGDVVTVKFSNGLEQEMKVKGIFDMDFIQIDTLSLINQKEYESINLQLKNTARQVNLKLEEGYDLDSMVVRIRNEFPDIEARSWKELAGIVESMTQSFEIIIIILRVIALLVAAITILIVTYVDLTNKRRQIGIQRAIGIIPETIILTYVLRAAFYSMVGTLVGALTFMFIIVPVEHNHPFTFPFGDVLMSIDYSQMLNFFVTLMIVSTIAALVPTINTIRIKILDAIWS
ncbi:MAG: FtsX-like permease family protein [Patescibacteria group bacterium]|nr:FtsX-like permease family protein [Patescibacteria group bacterium]